MWVAKDRVTQPRLLLLKPLPPRLRPAGRGSLVANIDHARPALFIQMSQTVHAHTSLSRGNCPAIEHGR